MSATNNNGMGNSGLSPGVVNPGISSDGPLAGSCPDETKQRYYNEPQLLLSLPQYSFFSAVLSLLLLFDGKVLIRAIKIPRYPHFSASLKRSSDPTCPLLQQTSSPRIKKTAKDREKILLIQARPVHREQIRCRPLRIKHCENPPSVTEQVNARPVD